MITWFKNTDCDTLGGINKIQRFSEDIDFRIHTERTFTRAEKKIFCNFILEKLESKEGFNSCVMYFRVNFNVIQMP